MANEPIRPKAAHAAIGGDQAKAAPQDNLGAQLTSDARH
jgi:hypothetical protein